MPVWILVLCLCGLSMLGAAHMYLSGGEWPWLAAAAVLYPLAAFTMPFLVFRALRDLIGRSSARKSAGA